MTSRRSNLLRLITAVLAVSLMLPAVAEDDAELAAVRAKVSDMFDLIDPENVKRSPVDGWYIVQKGSIVAYISGDGLA